MVNKNSGDARLAAPSVAVCPCLEHHDLVSQTTETRHCTRNLDPSHASLDQEESIDSKADPEKEKEYKPGGNDVLVGSTVGYIGCWHPYRGL